MQNDGEQHRIELSAENARQGRIVLDTRAKRAALLGAVAATAVIGAIAVYIAVG